MATIGTSGIDVSRLCLGANVFGWTADRDTSFAVLDAYVAGGGNFVDTADSYMWRIPGNSGGESETIIGEWFAAHGRRDDVVLATKVSSLPVRKGLAAVNGMDNLEPSLIDLPFSEDSTSSDAALKVKCDKDLPPTAIPSSMVSKEEMKEILK